MNTGNSTGSNRASPTSGSGGRKPDARLTEFYEEDEEGYVSGEYEDGPFELMKIRVKVCI